MENRKMKVALGSWNNNAGSILYGRDMDGHHEGNPAERELEGRQRLAAGVKSKIVAEEQSRYMENRDKAKRVMTPTHDVVMDEVLYGARMSPKENVAFPYTGGAGERKKDRIGMLDHLKAQCVRQDTTIDEVVFNKARAAPRSPRSQYSPRSPSAPSSPQSLSFSARRAESCPPARVSMANLHGRPPSNKQQDLTEEMSTDVKRDVDKILCVIKDRMTTKYRCMRDAFRAVDLDNDGGVCPREMRNFVRSFGLPEEKADGIFHALDRHGRGHVKFRDFVQVFGVRDKKDGAYQEQEQMAASPGSFTSSQAGQSKPRESYSRLHECNEAQGHVQEVLGHISDRLVTKYKSVREAFRCLDTNGDHTIDKTEMRTFMRNFGLSQRRSDVFFDALDVDRSGQIDYGEFTSLFAKDHPKLGHSLECGKSTRTQSFADCVQSSHVSAAEQAKHHLAKQGRLHKRASDFSAASSDDDTASQHQGQGSELGSARGSARRPPHGYTESCCSSSVVSGANDSYEPPMTQSSPPQRNTPAAVPRRQNPFGSMSSRSSATSSAVTGGSPALGSTGAYPCFSPPRTGGEQPRWR
jgi:Ca2+-binding EF-hand superfamily protein